ncbi:MAG: type II secretion system F family protein [Candidatus Velthaea sp.]
MAALAPYAILGGAVGAIALLFAGLWEPLFARAGKVGVRFTAGLEAAGMKTEPQQFVLVLAGTGLAVWIALLLVIRPTPLVAVVLLVAMLACTAYAGRLYLRRRCAKRIEAFRDQLEGALRTLAGGVRVGLGIRQALVLTSEQSREPAKSEFMRVVGLSNVGLSILDAFDQLALRMTNTETAVLARVIRVQSQTGGDLGSVLEGLAGTIRDRRRLRRRVSAITAQGRATAWLLGLLPLAVGAFVLTQAELRDAMLGSIIGRTFLGIALFLDALAVFTLGKIARIDP